MLGQIGQPNLGPGFTHHAWKSKGTVLFTTCVCAHARACAGVRVFVCVCDECGVKGNPQESPRRRLTRVDCLPRALLPANSVGIVKLWFPTLLGQTVDEVLLVLPSL